MNCDANFALYSALTKLVLYYLSKNDSEQEPQ